MLLQRGLITFLFALASLTAVAVADPFMACMERTIRLLDNGELPPTSVAESALETCRAQSPVKLEDPISKAAVDRTRAEVIEIFSHRVRETRIGRETKTATEE